MKILNYNENKKQSQINENISYNGIISSNAEQDGSR